jgi:hypothetical protein
MARRFKTGPASPADVSDARIAWLKAEMLRVDFSLGDAKEAGSHSAVAALHRQLQSLRGDLDAALLHRAEVDVKHETDAANLSPDEYRAWLQEHARSLPVHDLEVYVQAWAGAVGAMIEIEGGRAHLRYRCA